MFKKQKTAFLLFLLIIFASVSNVFASPLTELTPDSLDIPVIMYHNLSKNSGLLSQWTITPDEFEKDLQFLQDHGYETVFIEDLINYVNYGSPLPEKPIVLTFDDGDSSSHRYTMPLLEKYNTKAVFSIIGGPTDEYSSQDDSVLEYFPHITWAQINEMLETGLIEIANHSYNLHNGIGAKKKPGEDVDSYQDRLTADLMKMQNCTLENTGFHITTFTYPYGAFSSESVDILKEMGFQATLTCYNRLCTLERGNPDCLLSMNRIIRPHGTSLEGILKKYDK